MCKEVLGRIRSKFSVVPIPGRELTLDGEKLLTEAREDQQKLRDTFRELLESLTYEKLIEREATKAENLLRQLRTIPMPNGWSILMG